MGLAQWDQLSSGQRVAADLLHPNVFATSTVLATHFWHDAYLVGQVSLWVTRWFLEQTSEIILQLTKTLRLKRLALYILLSFCCVWYVVLALLSVYVVMRLKWPTPLPVGEMALHSVPSSATITPTFSTTPPRCTRLSHWRTLYSILESCYVHTYVCALPSYISLHRLSVAVDYI